MILGFLWDNQRTEIGTLSLDVLKAEKVSLDGEVTKYAVEDGTEISDHIFLRAEKLTISGDISDMDSYGIDTVTGVARHLKAIESLRAMRSERKLIRIVTGMSVYTDMGIANVTYDRDNSSEGNWLHVSIDLIKVKKVTLRRAELPPEAAAAPASGRAGTTAQRNTQTASSRTAPVMGPVQNPNDNTIAMNLRRNGAAATISDKFGLGNIPLGVGGR